MNGLKEKTPRQKGIPKILVLHTQTCSGGRNPSATQLTELSQAMDGHALQSVLQAGEGTVGMLPQR